ncbi:hypothetical protein Maes01_02817 [Microbulbifer aestuariivivens]|uniref:DUF6630 domain-containing protein n=1 Tax=Microbulbifer aestuariivivens TaxID=1908308 RepID=A0ABP9WSM5_9GAMM
MIHGLLLLVVASLFIYGCAENMKKYPSIADQALIDLAKGFSGNDEKVISEVTLFVANPKRYFKKYEEDLYQRGIEQPTEVTSPIALIDALSKAKYLVYQDVASEPKWVLSQLDELSNGAISKVDCYKQMDEYYSNTKYGIGTFLDTEGEWPSLFECIKEAGYNLIGINEDSDSYALVLLQKKDLPVAIETASKAGIGLYFAEK